MNKILKKAISGLGLAVALAVCSTPVFAGILKNPYMIYEGQNTTMTVLWQDNAVETTNTLSWGTDTSYSMGSVTVPEYGTSNQHKYQITGLQPSTKYYYQVTAAPGGTVYGTGSFVTAPAASATSVKFLAFGDTRSNPLDMEKVITQMRKDYAADPAYQSLTLQVGDWVSSDAESAWTAEWFNANPQTRALLAETPVNGVKGNHEGTGTYFAKYYPYPYVSGAYWSFDYGPLHVSVVDQYTGGGYTSGTAQYNWLVNDLATTTKPWKIILIHEPGWAAGTHANNTTVQTAIQPLVIQYGVDMVLTGHNHNYVRAMVNNIPHVTDGGGGAPLYAVDTTMPNVVTAYSGLSYCTFDINGNTLTMTAKKTDGSVIETFTVTHSAAVPAAPTGLTATAGNAQVSLSWTASSGATSYNVKRGTVSGGPYTTVAPGVTSTSITDTGLTNGTTYYYVVSAVNAIGESVNSSQVSATPIANPAPGAFNLLTPVNAATNVSRTSTAFDWSDSTGATSYSIVVSKNSNLSSPVINQSGLTASNYTSTVSLGSKTKYYWQVTATNANGSTASSVFSFTTKR
jgi:predicted phosphodiesterase